MRQIIDVAKWNGTISKEKWKIMKNSGLDGAIIKIINKQRKPDDQFYNNQKGVTAAGLPWGVYNYTYAVTPAQARSDMNLVCDMLDKIDKKYFKFGIWFDLEDKCQAALKKSQVTAIVNAAQEVVEKRGYKFGVYTGEYYFREHLDKAKLKCKNFWMARYYKGSTTMPLPELPNQNYKPHTAVEDIFAWQYTDACTIPGISGKFDMSIWYHDFDGAVKTETIIKPQTMKAYEGKLPVLPSRGYYKNGDGIAFYVMHRDQIRDMQRLLNWIEPKDPLVVDGMFGDKTEERLKTVQKALGCTKDGKFGMQTLSACKYFKR